MRIRLLFLFGLAFGRAMAWAANAPPAAGAHPEGGRDARPPVSTAPKPIRLGGQNHLAEAFRVMDHAVTSVIWDPGDITPRHSYMPPLDDANPRFLPIPEAILTPRANANLAFLMNNLEWPKAPSEGPTPDYVAEADAWAVMEVAKEVLDRFDPESFQESPETQLAAAQGLWDGLRARGFVKTAPAEPLAIPGAVPAAKASALSKPSGSRRERKEREIEKLWRKVEVLGREKGLKEIAVTVGNFAHIDSGEPIKGARFPRIPAKAFKSLAQGRQVFTMELPPRAVNSFWESRANPAPRSAVAEKNSFWRKAMSAAISGTRQNLFGVDADSKSRHLTHRLWQSFMGHGIMDERPGIEWAEGRAIPLEAFGAGPGEILAETALARLPEERRRELAENGIAWLEAEENPFARRAVTLYRRPHASWDEVYAILRSKYGPLFAPLGYAPKDLDQAITMYLTLALAALRDFMQARMMAEHLYRYLRDGAPQELSADKVLRVLHVGGAAHHLSLTRRLEATGLFGKEGSLLKLESPFLDPRLAGADMIGSRTLADMAPELLNRMNEEAGEARVDADYLAGHFGIYLERHGDMVHDGPVFERFEELVREGGLEEAGAFVGKIAAASPRFRERGLYDFLEQLLSPKQPVAGSASAASRRRYALAQLARAHGRPLLYAGHQSLFILRNALSRRGWRAAGELLRSLPAFMASPLIWSRSQALSDMGRLELVQARVRQAGKLAEDGRYAEAEPLLKEALAIGPGYPAALKLLKILSNPEDRDGRAEAAVVLREVLFWERLRSQAPGLGIPPDQEIKGS